MVMEFIENGDLCQHLDQNEYFDESLARFIAAELILAIEYVHS